MIFMGNPQVSKDKQWRNDRRYAVSFTWYWTG